MMPCSGSLAILMLPRSSTHANTPANPDSGLNTNENPNANANANANTNTNMNTLANSNVHLLLPPSFSRAYANGYSPIPFHTTVGSFCPI